MLIIEVKDKESIDRALKRYKRKYIRTGVRQEVMRRKRYVKPSTKRRSEIMNAIYRRQKEEELDN